MSYQPYRRDIIERVARGEITAEQGTHLLAGSTVTPGNPPETPVEERPPSIPLPWEKSQWWMIPFGGAVAFTMLVVWFGYLALTSTGPGFWFYFWVILFLFGTLGMIVAWQTRQTRWLHLRIRQAPGRTPQQINLSLPFPIGIATWFFRHFGQYFPQTRDISLDKFMDEIDRGLTPDAPFTLHVDGDGGEQVDISIG